MIDGQNFFKQPVATSQWDDHSSGRNLSKQQTLDADPKATQQVNLTGYLAQVGDANTTMIFIIEEAKETILDFSQGDVEAL